MVSVQQGSDPWRLIGDVRRGGKAGEEVEVRGWVRTRRDSKAGLSFLELNDGSSFNNLQIIAPAALANYESEIKKLGSGASVAVQGLLQESPGEGQAIELHATQVRVLGWADPDTYPLQKKRHSYEKLREWAHLRPRTNTFGAIARVRNQLSHSIHEFFQSRKFLYLHAPIITASDCEGAGQMFRVTTLDLEKALKSGKPIDWTQDFFGKSAYLTVSGQLEGETYATALGRIYTFGPTFRAENSNTSRHLAEFWMIEPEVAFYDLADNMRLAEDFIRYLLQIVLEHCSEDMAFFEERVQPGLIAQLRGVADKSFTHLSYTEAVKILEQSGQKFEYPVKWGIDLQAEHERFLTEQHIQGPVILTDYPPRLNPFTCVCPRIDERWLRWMYWFPELVKSSVVVSAKNAWMCLSHA